MVALADACQNGSVDARIALVVVPTSNSPALPIAHQRQFESAILDPLALDFGDKLLHTLEEHQVEFVCLAGFLRLIPRVVLDRFSNRILNIHPALLPKFGGKGMYGHHVHEAVLAARESHSGATVHLVNEKYDEGAILIQECCPVMPDDTPARLAERVLAIEHRIYPQALQSLIQSYGRNTHSA
jgi:phosphoribosylglycinamide formyltransferase-1